MPKGFDSGVWAPALGLAYKWRSFLGVFCRRIDMILIKIARRLGGRAFYLIYISIHKLHLIS